MCPLEAKFDTSPKTTVVVRDGQERIPITIGGVHLELTCGLDGTWGNLSEGEGGLVNNYVFRRLSRTRVLSIDAGNYRRGRRKGAPKRMKAVLTLS